MIRTFAILAGGFLGFAAALMIANSPVPGPAGATTSGYAGLDSGQEKQYAQFETDLGGHPARVPFEPFSDDSLNRDDKEPTASVASGPSKSGVTLPAIDKTSNIYRVQVELARLDCFAGDVDGRWSLGFHEALSDLVLTSELDLKRVGTISEVLAALRRQEIGVCAEPENFVESAPQLKPWIVTNVPLPALRKPRVRPSGHREPYSSAQSVGTVDGGFVDRHASTRAFERLENATVLNKVALDGDPDAVMLPESFRAELKPPVANTALGEAKKPYIFPIPEGRHADVFARATRSVEWSINSRHPVVAVRDPEPLSITEGLVTHGAVRETVSVDKTPTAVRRSIPEPSRATQLNGAKKSRLASVARRDQVIGNVVQVPPTSLDLSQTETLQDQGSVDENSVIDETDGVKLVVDVPANTFDIPLPVRKDIALPLATSAPRVEPKRKTLKRRRSVRSVRNRRRAPIAKRRPAPKKVLKKSKPTKAKKSWKHDRAAIFSSRG